MMALPPISTRNRSSRRRNMPNLSVIEAARALGLSEDTLRRQIRRGERPELRDAAGRLRVQLDDSVQQEPASEIEFAGRSTGKHAYTAGAVRLLERERDVLVTQLSVLQQSLGAAAERESSLLRALHQQQALQAQAAGMKLHDPDGLAVAETSPPSAPRKWWKR